MAEFGMPEELAGNEEGGSADNHQAGERRRLRDRCDCELNPCDACDCSLLLRLSTLLRIAAAVAPPNAGRTPVLALLGFYRRRITRFTPRCPTTPSCSAFAVAAVEALGPRRGLAAAARRVRRCR